MEYHTSGLFRKRINRFLGDVEIEGKNYHVHIHDPGRLEELLIPGHEVLLEKKSGKGRKTEWDIIAVRSEGEWVFIHSGYHSIISERIIRNENISPFGEVKSIISEVKSGKSRLDFYIETKEGKGIYLEVKGCTLSRDGVALFPDAPTERGRKHIEELIKLKNKGFNSAVFFLVFAPAVRCFSPNSKVDPLFTEVFEKSLREGVKVYPFKLKYIEDQIYYLKELPLCEIK